MKYENIFEAARNRDLEAVKHFVEVEKIHPQTRNEEKDTAGHIAAKNLDLDTVEYLLKKSPTLLVVRGQEDLTLLEIAIGMNSLTLLKQLVDDFKADIYLQGDMNHPGTIVHFAAQMCNLRIFKYFIEEKYVDVNLKDVWGQPLGFAAAREACLKIIKYLVETRNADLSVLDNMGRNILSQSAIKCDLIVPKYLLDQRKLNIDIHNTFIINDALEYTAKMGSNNIEEFLEYFVENKRVDVNGGLTETPLHRAAILGMLDVVKYLIRHGADVNRKNVFQETPLQVATDENVIKYLRDFEENSRSRRSLSATPHQTSICAGIRSAIIRDVPTSIDHAAMNTFERLGNVMDSQHRICILLLLANVYVNAKGRRRIPFFPQETIESQMDPVAVEAVYDYLS